MGIDVKTGVITYTCDRCGAKGEMLDSKGIEFSEPGHRAKETVTCMACHNTQTFIWGIIQVQKPQYKR